MKTKVRLDSGNTLLVTVITMAIVGVFIDLAMQYTNSIGRNVQRSMLLRQATGVADASTEMAFSAWRAICRQNQSKIYKRSDIDTEIPTPSPASFPGVTYKLLNYAVYPLDSYWNKKTAGSSTPAPIAGPNHGDLSYYYLATADVIVPTVSSKTASNLAAAAALTDKGNVIARVRRVFQKESLSLWRYAIFYDDDMEIHPGPTMNVTGDVHTNGSLYTGHNTLTLSGKTTYTDTWSIGFMNGDSTHPEKPTSPNWATGLPPAADQEQQPYGVHLDDYHALIDYTTTATSLDPYRFQSQASVVVTIDGSNNIRVFDKTGALITTNGNGNGNGGRLKTSIINALTTDQNITDKREGATTGNGTIRLTTLDVSQITAAANSGDLNYKGSFNGIIYIVDTSADPNGVTAKRGIRLVNGGKLPNGGLTVASANPVYVQGDYNTGTVPSSTPGATPSIQPPSNSGDPTNPTIFGYDRQPAAVVSDAVTILSNSWQDSSSGTMPAASATTVNAAIVSGNVPTGNGYYSGGVENFPRFLENWGGKNFTYYGSMIQLYQSKQGIGRWGAASVYGAPNRAWYFDTNFVASPPPGLLASFNYRRSRWYME
ncbi:MAG: hypothetical protein ACR2G0_02255 [Chthoniobacterales bacterium]